MAKATASSGGCVRLRSKPMPSRSVLCTESEIRNSPARTPSTDVAGTSQRARNACPTPRRADHRLSMDQNAPRTCAATTSRRTSITIRKKLPCLAWSLMNSKAGRTFSNCSLPLRSERPAGPYRASTTNGPARQFRLVRQGTRATAISPDRGARTTKPWIGRMWAGRPRISSWRHS